MSARASDWLGAMVEAARELAAGSLGCDVEPAPPSTANGLRGACIAIVGEKASIEMAVLSDAPGCQRMSRGLLGMSDDEPPLSDEDMCDALGEIVNILAGAVKTKMIDADKALRLGLPLCVTSPVWPSGSSDRAEIDLQIGESRTHLVIVQQRHAA